MEKKIRQKKFTEYEDAYNFVQQLRKEAQNGKGNGVLMEQAERDLKINKKDFSYKNSTIFVTVKKENKGNYIVKYVYLNK